MSLARAARIPGLLVALFSLAGPAAAQEPPLFPEWIPPLSIPSSEEGASPWQAHSFPAEGPFLRYAPADVEDLGGGLPHAAHVLTAFYPRPPASGDRFPAVLFTGAGSFLSSPPGTDPPGTAFLDEALSRGYAVLCVGTVGIDSCPVTGTQPPRCNPPGVCGSSGTPCRDYNLFYPPDATPGSPWNDFNVFYGEKDLTWAVQFVRWTAAQPSPPQEIFVDPGRIVLAGTSTGSIYALFVAYASTAWDPALLPGVSEQSQTEPSVAGVVAFEPVVWLEGLAPSGYPPGVQREGFHWPRSGDPASPDYLVRATWVDDAPTAVLEDASPSTWIRASGRDVPVFIASGDGNDDSTGFGRNGNNPQFGQTEDYDRDPLSQDPLFTFPTPPFEPTLRLHDFWHGRILAGDLAIADAAFHAQHSVLHGRKDMEWQNFPASLTLSGVAPGGPNPNPNDIPLLDGTYFADCTNDGVVFPDPPSVPGDCASAENWAIARTAADWLDRELAPGVEHRNKTPNPDALRMGTARVGESFQLVVDFGVSGVDARYDTAEVHGYVDAGATQICAPLSNGYVLLCDIGDPTGNGELLMQPFTAKDPATGRATFTAALPAENALAGLDVCVVACLYDFCIDGQPPYPECVRTVAGEDRLGFAVTNAQDFELLPTADPPRAWINELHYDDQGPDDGELVEIAGKEGTSLVGWSLSVYDGAGVELYAVPLGPGALPGQQNGFGALAFDLSANGLPDGPGGLALVDFSGGVVEFPSWEGSFLAQDGPAAGTTSTDIGVSEPSTTPEGQSLQLTGRGAFSEDFAWQAPAAESPGALNAGELLVATPQCWVHELHYDNQGPDAGEFVEIAGISGSVLDGWELAIYDGVGGLVLDTFTVPGAPALPGGTVIPEEEKNYGAVELDLSAIGLPDGTGGIAVVDGEGRVVEFPSWEGAFVAADGPAKGMLSVDVGVFEDPATTPAGHSLQRTGTGFFSFEFTWQPPSTESRGALNAGQSIADP